MDAATAEMIQVLIEERAISRRILRFARSLDEKDFAGYATGYAVDGILTTPRATHHGREGLAQFVENDLGGYTATQHVSAAHDIELNGNTAIARSALLATHVSDQSGEDFWAVGGWYDLELEKIDGEWLFTRVTINRTWIAR